MPHDRDISHQEPLPEYVNEHDLHGVEQDFLNLEQANPVQRESNGKRPCALLGSAILHLRLWGRQSFASWKHCYSHMQDELRRLPEMLLRQMDAARKS